MKFTKRTYTTVLLVGVLIVSLIFSLYLYSKNLKTMVQNEVIDSLGEISRQSVSSLEKEINGKYNLLVGISNSFSVGDDRDLTQLIGRLRQVEKQYGFMRMGIILPNGSCITTDEVEMDLSDREYFLRGMQGESTISTPLIDKAGGAQINVYSTPLYMGDQIIGVLFATYSTGGLRETLEVSTFGDMGYSYVVAANGDTIVDSTNPASFKGLQNIFTSLLEVDPQNGEMVQALQQDLAEGRTGYTVFRNREEKYLYFRPLGINDWYLLTVVPENVANDRLNAIMSTTYLLCFVLIGLFLVLIAYLIWMERQKKNALMTALYVDSITGGYTDAKFYLEAEKSLKKHKGEKAALLAVDIDRFKLINDLFGYQNGDQAIRYLWDVLVKSLGRRAICGHQSGDKFLALVYYRDQQDLLDLVGNFCDRCKTNPLFTFRMIPSVGIYEVDPGEPLTVKAMVNLATIAQATIKGKQDLCYVFYDESFRLRMLHNKAVEDKIESAMAAGEFLAYYQPKYRASDKKLIGAEALARWRQPDGTILPPSQFIPVYEEDGLISLLDKYMFDRVCSQQRQWLDAGKQVVPISINLSRLHLYDPSFIPDYLEILNRYQLPVEWVQLELTETVMMEHQEAALSAINHLHQLGFQILMDDFGAGHSSLLTLNSVPVDLIKMDKLFADDIGKRKGSTIVRGMIELAHDLGLEVTAEGVETEEQFDLFQSFGCDSIQGYYFSRPLPKDEFEKLL